MSEKDMYCIVSSLRSDVGFSINKFDLCNNISYLISVEYLCLHSNPQKFAPGRHNFAIMSPLIVPSKQIYLSVQHAKSNNKKQYRKVVTLISIKLVTNIKMLFHHRYI